MHCSKSSSSAKTVTWGYCGCCTSGSYDEDTGGSNGRTERAQASHQKQTEINFWSPTERGQRGFTSQDESCTSSVRRNNGRDCPFFCNGSTTSSGHRRSCSSSTNGAHRGSGGSDTNDSLSSDASASKHSSKHGSSSNGCSEGSGGGLNLTSS